MSYVFDATVEDTGSAERKLPQELCDNIMDHLWDDPITLKACSLVCLDWVPTTRIHLFHTIRISPERAAIYADVIESPFVDFTPHVRGLVLDHSDVRFSLPAFPQWVKRFRNIESLTVQYSGFHRMADSYRADLVAFFPKLSALKLHSVHFVRWQHMWGLLGAFPKLETLHVVDGYDGMYLLPVLFSAGAVPARMQKSAQIKDLLLQTRMFSGLMNWLTKSPSGFRPRTLDLKKVDFGVGPETMDLLDAVAPSLETLRISMTTLKYLLRHFPHRLFSFLRKSRLRTFHVYDLPLFFNRHGEMPKASYWLPRILSRLNLVRMERLVLTIDFGTMNSLEAMGWMFYDTQLTRLQQQRPQLTTAIEVVQRPTWAHASVSMALPIAERILQGLANARRAGMRTEVIPVYEAKRSKLRS
ncbi:hypothetical protein B0H21DRAFT_826734 [Amylocystis lapponica]|nr:hypothetical protein B0H21DRAFT_826734 [Amylocystis lapponica]